MSIEQTSSPNGSVHVIPEPGPESYVVMSKPNADGQIGDQYPIVGWQWDGEVGLPLVAMADGLYIVGASEVEAVCVRGQIMYAEPWDDDEDDD